MANWTGNIFVDSLLRGWAWQTDTIDYYLTSGQWDAAETAAIQAAFDTWSHVADISFNQVFTSTGAEFVESQYSNTGTSVAGSHQMFAGFYTSPTIAELSGQLSGEYNTGHFGWTTQGIQPGGTGFTTLIHEIGHGLGLDHTHFTGANDPHVFPGVSGALDLGDNSLNQDLYSVMSYAGDITNPYGSVNGNDTTGFGEVATPMAFDIAAIQALYGANTTANSGDDIYLLPDSNVNGTNFSAIWDTGGVDEIRYEGSRSVEINLNPATLQNEDGGGGFLSRVTGTYNEYGVPLPIYGGFTIAADQTNVLADVNGTTGVIIEHATGGEGNDTLTGNGADNILQGNGGSDTLYGGRGTDYLFGGNGVDQLEGEADTDWLYGGGDNDTLNGGAGADLMWGDDGEDIMDGGDDGDFMWGGTGGDFMFGGDGVDWLRGEGGVDSLFGDEGDDILIGGEGNDIMEGGTGTDTFYGEADNDTINGGANGDVAFGQGGNDIINGGSEGDFLFGGAGADTINGGTENDLMWGDMPGMGDGVEDIFVFEDNWGFDAIYDFELGIDQISMGAVTGLNSFSQLGIFDGGANVTVAFAGNAITLYGVTLSELNANQADFDFS